MAQKVPWQLKTNDHRQVLKISGRLLNSSSGHTQTTFRVKFVT